MSARSMKRLAAVSLFVLCLMASLDDSKSALAQSSFGPESFTLTRKKATFTRTFAADAAIPYTLTFINGQGDGSARVKKGSITLNGQVILDNRLINRGINRLTLALHPNQQNEIRIKLKGGAGSFVSIAIEPTPSSALNFPISDADQPGLGTPFSVAVDQSAARAYIGDRHFDSVVEFDIEQARITRSFSGLDGDSTPGNGATSDVSFNPEARTIVAANQGEALTAGAALPAGSISVISQQDSSMRELQLSSDGSDLHPRFVAVNSSNNLAAFTVLYGNGRRAYFIDLESGAIATRDEDMVLTTVAGNPITGEFIFSGMEAGQSPALFVYGAQAGFARLRRIDSTASAGTGFQKVAINTATNVAVAVNQRDAAVFVFDLAAGRQVARIPILVGAVAEPSADVAVNPETNMAAVTSNFINRLVVIDLANLIVAAEIPLPEGARPLGVGVHNRLNRAVIAENGMSSSERNGSIIVVQLPSR